MAEKDEAPKVKKKPLPVPPRTSSISPRSSAIISPTSQDGTAQPQLPITMKNLAAMGVSLHPSTQPSPIKHLPPVGFSPLPSPILRSARPSSASSSGTIGSTGTGRRRRVQIITESPADERPPYRLDPTTLCPVTFPASTWHMMRASLGIALAVDNVFVCDEFLGRDGAERLLTELWGLRENGILERHMRRGADSRTYACLHLQHPDLPHINRLVTLVYKLASYHAPWQRVAVEISYHPDGHPRLNYTKPPDGEVNTKSHRQLKAFYFPNNDWNLNPEPSVSEAVAGCLWVENTHSTKPNHQVEPVFDRLVVFWGDALDHCMSSCPLERYGITIWLSS